jgi:dTDP-4-dehydrorhamnose 3,5-epimerase
MVESRYGTPPVVGSAELLAKKSAVDGAGQLRRMPVDGVVFRPTRPVPHEDGFLTEVARASWDVLDRPVTQVHVTTTYPERIRAWGLHQVSIDRLFVVAGLVKIVVFDGRHDSPSQGPGDGRDGQ